MDEQIVAEAEGVGEAFEEVDMLARGTFACDQLERGRLVDAAAGASGSTP